MKIVLISGKQGSGKTTLQKALCASWAMRYSKPAFAMNFADILYEMHDAVLSVFHKYHPPRNIAKDGPLLQLLGTEWGRNTIHTDIWVKCLKSKIEKTGVTYPEGLFVIGDARFENEFDTFPEALRVRLVCDEDVRKQRCSMWRENVNHPSEIGLDKYATDGRFDLYYATEIESVEHVVELILAQLQKSTWFEKRK